jgi:hypothetical protein
MGRRAKETPSPPSGRNHQCDVCGKVDVWGPSWSWYGAIDDEWAPKACSAECALALPKLHEQRRREQPRRTNEFY